MTDLLHDTLIAPVATPRHRKPDPAPSGPVARFVDNYVLPHVRGGFYGLGLAIVALAAEAMYLNAFGPRAAGAFAVEILVVYLGGLTVGSCLCKRIDAAAPSSSTSTRHRKVA